MYTQCPQCHTYFQVTPEHLKIAQGNVRCGQCRHVFNALGNLSERPPEIQHTPAEEDEFAELEDYAENEAKTGSARRKPSPKVSAKLKAQAKPQRNPVPAPIPTAAKPAKGAMAAGLNQAIQAINALKRGTKPLNSLEAGRDAILAKLQTHAGHNSKAVTAPPPKKSSVSAKPTKAQTAAAKIASAVVKPQDLPKARISDAGIQIDFDEADEFGTEFNEPFIESSESAADIDFDAALRAIDDLELNEEPQNLPAARTTATSASATTAPATSTKNEPKVKPLARNQRDQPPPLEAARRQSPQRTTPAATTPPPATFNNNLPAVIPTEDTIPTMTDIPLLLREDFAQNQAEDLHPIHWSNYAWIAGSILLMVVFLLQTVYFKHDDLGRNPALHTWIELFCKPLNCNVALPIDISRLELLGQDIRSHPKSKEALLVTTTIINNAPFAQAYPGLLLTFSDMNGRKIAMRRFSPAEYLNRSVNRGKGMLPDAPVQIELELFDPGSDAVNFEFDFFPYAE